MILFWLVLLIIGLAACLVVASPSSKYKRKFAKRNKWWQIK